MLGVSHCVPGGSPGLPALIRLGRPGYPACFTNEKVHHFQIHAPVLFNVSNLNLCVHIVLPQILKSPLITPYSSGILHL